MVSKLEYGYLANPLLYRAIQEKKNGVLVYTKAKMGLAEFLRRFSSKKDGKIYIRSRDGDTYEEILVTIKSIREMYLGDVTDEIANEMGFRDLYEAIMFSFLDGVGTLERNPRLLKNKDVQFRVACVMFTK